MVVDDRWTFSPSSLRITRLVSSFLQSNWRQTKPFFGPYGLRARRIPPLSETLLVSGFTDFSRREKGVAVDVGASPGGWTHQLAKDMETVIAIDPAELHESVLELENVHHVQKPSQNAAGDLEKILGDRNISLLTCDANRHPSFVAEMLAPVVKYVKPGGLMVITLKYSFKGRKKHKSSESMEELKESFLKFGYELDHMRTVWLLSNTAYEKTVLCRKK